jgi:hypothetical protein
MIPQKMTGRVANNWIERGIAVFFTTPALTQARMRRDDASKRCEFVLPSLSGGKGYYVMPWKSIMASITTTLHDRVLFEQIQKNDVDDPIKMRHVTLEVAAKGLAGPRAARKAQEILDSEKHYQLLTTFLLVLQLLKLADLPPNELIAQGIATANAQKRLKAALKDVAVRLNVPQDDLYVRIEALSLLIAPIGLPHAPEPGRLRLLSDDLLQFSGNVRGWTHRMPEEIAHLGEFEAGIADLTNRITTKTMQKVFQQTEALAAMLNAWEKHFNLIRHEVRQLAWMLDGWDYLISVFQDAAGKTEREREAVIADNFSLLPIPPKDQLEIISDQQMSTLSVVQKRWVRANEDWRSGLLDYEQVQRNEGRKAEMR